MIYTETGKYAIRALLYLAATPGGHGTATAAEIAAAEDIPAFYLGKVLNDLSQTGILTSVRGRGGGYRLSRPPSQVTALEVLEAAENLSQRVEACVLGLDQCSDETPCALHDYWSGFRDQALHALESLTLEVLLEELRWKRQRGTA